MHFFKPTHLLMCNKPHANFSLMLSNLAKHQNVAVDVGIWCAAACYSWHATYAVSMFFCFSNPCDTTGGLVSSKLPQAPQQVHAAASSAACSVHVHASCSHTHARLPYIQTNKAKCTAPLHAWVGVYLQCRIARFALLVCSLCSYVVATWHQHIKAHGVAALVWG